jgi:hypothetical protein
MPSDAQAPVKLSLPLVCSTYNICVQRADDIIGVPTGHLQ